MSKTIDASSVLLWFCVAYSLTWANQSWQGIPEQREPGRRKRDRMRLELTSCPGRESVLYTSRPTFMLSPDRVIHPAIESMARENQPILNYTNIFVPVWYFLLIYQCAFSGAGDFGSLVKALLCLEADEDLTCIDFIQHFNIPLVYVRMGGFG